MTAATVSIDRTSLSLGALSIGTDRTGTYCLTINGLGDPEMVWRFGTMPNSDAIHGREVTSAALEQSSLALEVAVQGTTSSDLRTKRVALTTALSQFTYTVTVTVDGVAQTWACDPANWSVSGGTVPHAHQDQFVQVMTLTIPVHPIAS